MRWKCTCSYDGSRYFGWQTQDVEITIQQTINEALFDIFKIQTPIAGSGRTDTGVHALGQVFHFDFDWSHGPSQLKKAISAKLPQDIRIESVEAVDDSFHARFSAVSKRYQYRIFPGRAEVFEENYCWSLREKTDFNAIADAMACLIGEHDFAAFASNRGKEYDSTVRTMMRADMRFEEGFVYLTFEANGFLYKMVRSLVGALSNIGLGRIEKDRIVECLATGQRAPFVYVAPARGLFLEKVFY